MNKKAIITRSIVTLFLLSLSFIQPAKSESPAAKFLSEAVGKKDPFEMIAPIIDSASDIPVRAEPDFTQPVPPAPELFVKSIMLKFLRAENLQVVAQSMTSQYGSISIDNGTNSLIICDTEDKVKKIVSEIQKADQTPRQILIEVVIVDVQLNDDTEIGVDWNYIFKDDAGNPTIKNDFSTVFGNETTSDYTGSLEQRAFNQTLTTMTTGGAFALIHDNILVTLRALQTTRNVEILATPKVLVLSGQEAIIKTVEEIPYEESSDTSEGGQITSIVFKEVGISLNVKAILNDDNTIMMTINPKQSVQTDDVNGVPVVDSREASTTLLMNDNEVVVMGGLRRKETTMSQSKVPLLGDLPFVGALFSNDHTITKHSELLVLISPHIFTNRPLTEYQREKWSELRNAPPLRVDPDSVPGETVIKTRPTHGIINAARPTISVNTYKD